MSSLITDVHHSALSKAKIRLMTKPDSVFFTTICFSLKHLFDYSVPTAATNGKYIKFNPDFFMKLDEEERVFLILHEAMHCAYVHMVRRGARDHYLFNCACDYVINLQLVERGFRMPACGLLDHAYKGMGAEEVYEILIKNPPPPKNEMGGDIEESCEEPVELEKEIKDILIRAAIQSKVASDKPGTIPGEIQIFLDRLLNPKMPWNRILQKYLQTFAKNDYSFRKPNRRYFPTHHLPSLYSETLMNIAIAIDTSGSVSDTDFLRFVTETNSILKMMKPEKITLVQFDTEIKSVDVIRNIHELMRVKFTGRGGTYINPLLDWANENKPQLLLVFTDGGFYFYTTETKVKTLWLINDNPQFNAPFGKTIHYSME